MTETGELTRDDLVIDPDMEIDDDGCIVTAYVETWFDVDRKFGTHTVDDAETWINFYAKYNTESGDFWQNIRLTVRTEVNGMRIIPQRKKNSFSSI